MGSSMTGREAHMRLVAILGVLLILAGCSWTGSMPVPENGPDRENLGESIVRYDPLYGSQDRSLVGPTAWNAIVERTAEQRKELEEALAPWIDRNEVIVSQLTENTLQIVTTEKSAFVQRTARLTQDIFPVLGALARVANTDGKSIITVFGDADRETPPELRERLAMQRGEAVREELIRRGVSPLLVSATGDPQRDHNNGRMEITMQPLVPPDPGETK